MKKTFTYRLAALIGAILSLVSCIYDGYTDTAEGPGLIFRVRTESSTKVSYDNFHTYFENGDIVGCVIAEKTAEGFTYMSNTKWSFDNDVLMLQADDTYIKKVADEIKAAEGYVELAGNLGAYSFFFYYPYVEATPGEDFPKSGEEFLVQTPSSKNWTGFPLFVNLEQTTKEKLNCSDFLWVGYTLDQKSGTNDITMDNANYPVNLEFLKKTATIELISDTEISGTTIKSTVPSTGDPRPIMRGCSIDLSTGAMSAYMPATDDSDDSNESLQYRSQKITSEEGFTPFNYGSSRRFRFILPAQEDFSGTLSFTLNEKNYSAVLSNLTTLEEGKLYLIYIASDDGSIIINDWVDDGFSDLEEILPGQIIVATMTAERFKAGYTITITGEELNETATIRMTEATINKFTVNDEGTVLSFVIPESAQDGEVTLISGSGSESVAGEVTLVKPSEITMSPSSIKPGETLTISGKDLDLVEGVTFGGDVDVDVTSTETEISVTVPASAVTGNIMLELKNGTSIEGGVLTVLQPSVTSMTANRFKAGNVVTITGANLDMVKSVVLPGSGEVALSSHTAETITFILPELAQDGQIILVNKYDGKIVSGKCILELVKPTFVSYSPSDKISIGESLTINGNDLDLVTGVIFNGDSSPVAPNAGGSETSITVTVPNSAKSGELTLTLANGTTVGCNYLTVRGNPDITSITRDANYIYVNGSDLDIATAVKINESTLTTDKYSVNADGSQIVISMTASELAAFGISGNISVENSVVDTMPYDFTPSVTSFDKTTVSVGETVTLSGANLDLVGSVTFTGGVSCEVASASYSALSFVVPEDFQAGVITLTCIDTTTQVTPSQEIIKALAEEVELWEGSISASWGNAAVDLSQSDKCDWTSMNLSTTEIVIRVYFEYYGNTQPYIRLFNHYGSNIKDYSLSGTDTILDIEITSDIYSDLTSNNQTKGFRLGGHEVTFKKVLLILEEK